MMAVEALMMKMNATETSKIRTTAGGNVVLSSSEMRSNTKLLGRSESVAVLGEQH
jgi:hypothetical protein